jgi:SHS2 domain-containing protein
MDFEMLSHTSEAKFRAYGKTVEERFINAGRAMTDIMFDAAKLSPVVRRHLVIKGRDGKTLLHNWLEELLFLLDTERFVLVKTEKPKITQIKEMWTLDITLYGQIANETSPRRGPEVKAVTYAEMEVTPEFVQVVVDV